VNAGARPFSNIYIGVLEPTYLHHGPRASEASKASNIATLYMIMRFSQAAHRSQRQHGKSMNQPINIIWATNPILNTRQSKSLQVQNSEHPGEPL